MKSNVEKYPFSMQLEHLPDESICANKPKLKTETKEPKNQYECKICPSVFRQKCVLN